MGFVKKHIVWLVLGIVLLAEGGLTFILLAKQVKAKAARGNFERQQQTLDDYKRKPPGQPKVLKALAERKEAVRDELTDCLLFLWHRGQALERLFPDPELAKANVRPWSEARDLPMDMGRFKRLYQDVYDREVKKLASKLDKLLIGREAAGFAPTNFFTLSDITIGDIFAAQKKFWILKEIVEAAARAEMANLAQIQTLREEPALPAAARRARGVEDTKGKFFSPITLRLVVRCKYPKLSGFLEGLHRSPLGIRIRSVANIQRSAGLKEPVADFEAVAPRAPRRPFVPAAPFGPPPGAEGGMTPEMLAEGAPAVPRPPRARRAPRVPMAPMPVPRAPAVPVAPRTAEAGKVVEQLIEVHLLCELPGFNVDIQEVSFNRKDFPTNKNVKKWVEGQLAAAKAMLLRAKTAAPRRNWATRAMGELAAQPGPLPPPKEKAPAPAEKKPLTLIAYPGRPYEREYVIDDTRLARDWLRKAGDYETLRVAVLQAFWERVLAVLETTKTSSAGDVTLTFRTKSHFDPKQRFSQNLRIQLAAPGPSRKPATPRRVNIKFGVVTLAPTESIRGRALWARSTAP